MDGRVIRLARGTRVSGRPRTRGQPRSGPARPPPWQATAGHSASGGPGGQTRPVRVAAAVLAAGEHSPENARSANGPLGRGTATPYGAYFVRTSFRIRANPAACMRIMYKPTGSARPWSSRPSHVIVLRPALCGPSTSVRTMRPLMS